MSMFYSCSSTFDVEKKLFRKEFKLHLRYVWLVKMASKQAPGILAFELHKPIQTGKESHRALLLCQAPIWSNFSRLLCIMCWTWDEFAAAGRPGGRPSSAKPRPEKAGAVLEDQPTSKERVEFVGGAMAMQQTENQNAFGPPKNAARPGTSTKSPMITETYGHYLPQLWCSRSLDRK